METELLAALVGVCGVLIGGSVQWLIARSTIRSETERLHRQLSSEFRLQQFSEWQTEFRNVISELLAITDLEAQQEFSKKEIIPLVLKAQLMLNLHLQTHSRVNELMNRLALTINGWHDAPDSSTLFRIHGALLDASRDVLFLPGK